MITITRGTTNQIILTLTEKVSISNPVFLFEFTNDQTRQAYCFIAADVSLFTYRYNAFQVTETTSPNLLSSQVSLSSPGDYHYAVYQQSSVTNLDPNQTLGLLETGKLRVMNASGDTNTVYDPGQETNIVYQ
jgi:hypothetical protein